MNAGGIGKVATEAFVRGMVIAATAGAVAGTMVIPLFGTVYGLLTAAVYGVVPSAIGALIVAGVLRQLPSSDLATVRSRLRRTVFVYGAVVWLASGPFLAMVVGGAGAGLLIATWLVTGAVIAALLPRTADGLARSYADRRRR